MHEIEIDDDDIDAMWFGACALEARALDSLELASQLRGHGLHEQARGSNQRADKQSEQALALKELCRQAWRRRSEFERGPQAA
jgi:hypothetical protein